MATNNKTTGAGVAERLDYRSAMKVDLPEIDTEGVRVTRFTVSEVESARTRFELMQYGRGYVPAGEYTRLVVDGTLWMSDTPDELRDHAAPFMYARRHGGRVLVNGLGLGMVVTGLLRLDNVEHVDVVEKDERVARIIGVHYASERCTIHHADAYDITWPAGTRWSLVWNDIWPDITGDNWEGMKRLHRRYGRRADFVDSWCRYEVRRAARLWVA